MARIKLPSGEYVECGEGKRIIDCIPAGVGLVARVDGKLVDLTETPPPEGEVEVLDFNSEEGRRVYWHTTSHVMAQAVKALYPDAKLGIGPPIENGFYYDFDVGGRSFTPEELERIEEKMREIVEKDIPIKRVEMSREEAIDLFRSRGEPYKVELLEEMEDDRVTVYWQGDFVDLCRGPHLPSTGYVKHFKLLTASSAYWRGVETNPAMQRIYGISFPEEEMLKKHLEMLEEAKRRDHRILGAKLDLFSIHEESGAGLILWHPKGAMLRKIISDFVLEEYLKRGYQLVATPHIAKGTLWEISGHMGYYLENMYVFEKEGETYVVKPMNCPFHILIYKTKTRSYRDLPIRYTELGTVYRYERSGTLHGLMRVRGFTQDDAHIFCTPEQLEEEILGVLDLTLYILRTMGFHEYKIVLSTRDPEHPERYMGTDEEWTRAQEALAKALEKRGLPYEEAPGEAVFYGPKIDIKLVDAIGRTWQCTTIQIDFNLPRRFNVTYVGPDGREHHVIMIHRALLGSIERFIGVLIEHYAGNFPLWLAPVQVRVLPVSDRYVDYATSVYQKLRDSGLRVELDDRPLTVSYRIREAEEEKIPYMVIVGGREAESSTISVRRHTIGDLGQFSLEEFIARLKEEIANRR